MFWRFPYSTSQLHTLLDKEDLTLKEILDEDDVLQECKSNNEKLIDFLIKAENLNTLIDNVIQLPSEELAERDRFKYSCISCELLTCDIPIINEALINDADSMNKLYMFLADNQTLNPILGSYFSKIIGNLVTKKPENFLYFIQQKDDFLPNLLKHIDTSAIMDILLRLVALLENKDQRVSLVEWFKSIRLIKNLVDLFASKYSNEVHSNVSQLLCEIIKLSRDQIQNIREGMLDPNMFHRERNLSASNDEQSQDSQMSQPDISISHLLKNSLLDEIESDEIIEALFQNMQESFNQTNCSVTYILDVFFTIFEPILLKNIIESSSNDYLQHQSEQEKLKKDKERIEIAFKGIKAVTSCCLKHFNQIHQMILTNKPKYEKFRLTNGKEIPTLGIVRLSLIKLVAKLVGLNDESINDEVIKHGTIKILIDMFFTYKWNNFLHTLVTEIITNSLNSDFKFIDIEFENQMAVDENKNEENSSSATTENKVEESPVEKIAEFMDANTFTKYYFKECNLIKRLVDAWYEFFENRETNSIADNEKPKPKKPNTTGYIGHLTVISNHIYKNTRESKYSAYMNECLTKWVDKDILEQWNELNQTKIANVNAINARDLVRNPLIANSPDSCKFDSDLDLPSDACINKKLMDFNKDMKTYFEETKFNLKQTMFGKPKTNESAQMFEEVCMARDNIVNFGNIEEDVWVSQDIKFADGSEKKDEWVAADENMFKTSTDDDMFKTSESTFLQTMIKKNTVETNLASQTKSLSSKKYSENLSLTNYSSSSSSSSNEGSDSDEDNEFGEKVSKSSKSSKRHHHQDRTHFSHFHKETKSEIKQDISEDAMSTSVADKEDNWADFDAFITAESAKDNTSSKNLENMLNTDTDPWGTGVSTSDPLSVPAATVTTSQSSDDSTKPSSEKEDANWANFDNFN